MNLLSSAASWSMLMSFDDSCRQKDCCPTPQFESHHMHSGHQSNKAETMKKTLNDLSESDLKEYEDYEARLARPIHSVSDITDDLTHVLAETGLANRVLNKLGGAIRPGSLELETTRPHLVMEHAYGIGDGLDDFQDRQQQLRQTLTVLLQRGHANVTTAVRILRAAKDDARHLSTDRMAQNPRVRGARLTIRKELERSAKKALAFFSMVPADLPQSPWVALYRDIREAVKHDPFLNPPSSRRGRGETRHQEILTKTGTQLRKLGISAADVKTLLQATGLIDLLKAKRRARPSKRA